MMHRSRDLLAVALLAPAPTAGVLAALLLPEGTAGKLMWAFCKAWLLLLPMLWWFFVDRRRLALTRPTVSSIGHGLLVGVAMALVITLAFMLIGIGESERGFIQQQLSAIGILSPWIFVLMALYWSFVNSLVEEYVFRWFIMEKSAVHIGQWGALLLSAIIFTIHHTVVVAFFLDWMQTLLATVGVFSAAVIWSWQYARYQHIWAAYVSHVLADLAIFSLLFTILFL